MIGKWLARRTDIEQLETRLAAVERDLPRLLALVGGIGADLRRLDQQTIAATLEIARVGRRIEALRRLARQGGAALERIDASAAASRSAVEQDGGELARIKASLAILEYRIESEAEQARLSATGLFERIETIRRDAANPDRQ